MESSKDILKKKNGLMESNMNEKVSRTVLGMEEGSLEQVVPDEEIEVEYLLSGVGVEEFSEEEYFPELVTDILVDLDVEPEGLVVLFLMERVIGNEDHLVGGGVHCVALQPLVSEVT